MVYSTFGKALQDSGSEQDPDADGPVISDVWHGRRPLGEIFWKYGFFVGGVAMYASLVVCSVISGFTNSQAPYYLWIVLTTPVNVWLYVGLWRSATRNPGGWATVVKIYVVLSAIRQVASWVRLVS